MPIANKYCIRASAYPEKYVQAQEKCSAEGAYLLQYTNEEIHVSISGMYSCNETSKQ